MSRPFATQLAVWVLLLSFRCLYQRAGLAARPPAGAPADPTAALDRAPSRALWPGGKASAPANMASAAAAGVRSAEAGR
jgi:hypothetical protein